MPNTTDHAWEKFSTPTPEEALALSRFEKQIPLLLSVIAGMLDVTSFLTLGGVFSAHITGNLVVVAALLARGDHYNLAQILAIPVFMLAVAIIWKIAKVRENGVFALQDCCSKFSFFCSSVFRYSALSLSHPRIPRG